MIEEEEHGVGIAREPDLRRRDVREHGQRHAIVVPAERVTQQTKKGHRSLPAIPDHVLDVHRCRPVLQDDDVDAGAIDDGGDAARAGERDRQRREREDEEQPRPQLAADREALTDRQRSLPAKAPQIRQAAPEPPQPREQQHRGRREEPQKLWRPESNGVHPLRSRLPPGVASGWASRSPYSIGASICRSSILASGGGAPGRPWMVGPIGRSPAITPAPALGAEASAKAAAGFKGLPCGARAT